MRSRDLIEFMQRRRPSLMNCWMCVCPTLLPQRLDSLYCCTWENVWQEKQLVNLVNRELSAKIFLANIHRKCIWHTNCICQIFLANTCMVCQNFPAKYFPCMVMYHGNWLLMCRNTSINHRQTLLLQLGRSRSTSVKYLYSDQQKLEHRLIIL